MKNKVKETIKRFNLIESEDKILVAVSGGPDSLSLLNILYELEYNLCVAHVNHGLRENADIDEEFVCEFCQKRNIPCFVKKIKLKEELQEKYKGMSLEEAGRKARYDFFTEVAKNNNCNKIATAHNNNDNVETIIMNLIRGSGLSGLKGIEAKRDNLIRPLIEIKRQEIEDYCNQNKLNPRLDETNNEALYTRNKIRLELIPYIEKNVNSNVMQNISRMSQIVQEEERFITNEVEKAYNMILKKEEINLVVLDSKKFNKLDLVLKRRIILKSIIKVLGNAKDIEKVHVDDIVKLCNNNVGGKYLTPNKNIKVSILHGKLVFERIGLEGGQNEKTI